MPPKTGGELFIVDNSDSEWKGLRYLQDWTELASAFDIATARYLPRELQGAGIAGVDEIDSGSKTDRGDAIQRFAPYDNGTTSAELAADRQKETRILISTDVLSEGLMQQVPAPVGVKPVLKCWLELN